MYQVTIVIPSELGFSAQETVDQLSDLCSCNVSCRVGRSDSRFTEYHLKLPTMLSLIWLGQLLGPSKLVEGNPV